MILALCATASLSRSRIETTATTLPPSITEQVTNTVLVHQPQTIGEGLSEINRDHLS